MSNAWETYSRLVDLTLEWERQNRGDYIPFTFLNRIREFIDDNYLPKAVVGDGVFVEKHNAQV